MTFTLQPSTVVESQLPEMNPPVGDAPIITEAHPEGSRGQETDAGKSQESIHEADQPDEMQSTGEIQEFSPRSTGGADDQQREESDVEDIVDCSQRMEAEDESQL